MKKNKSKTLELPATIKVREVDGVKYYNLVVNVDGMDVCVKPQFLNFRQSILLKHKLARLVGDEHVK